MQPDYPNRRNSRFQPFLSSDPKNGRKASFYQNRSRFRNLRGFLINFSHQWHQTANPQSILKIFSIFFIFLLVSNYFGFLDRLFELNFEENFDWPSGHVDILKQVKLHRNGKMVEYLPLYSLDFRFLATPKDEKKICAKKHGVILILVKSRPKNEQRRTKIREWWKKQKGIGKETGMTVVLYFLTGSPTDPTLSTSLLAESVHHGDLIRSDHIDTGDPCHTNQTASILASWKWIYENCENTPAYTLMITDQYRISIGNLLRFLNDLQSEKIPVYSGYRHDRVKVSRSPFGSWLSLSEYPFSHFPPFIDPGAVLFSKEAVQLFYLGSQYVKPFKFEHVFVGIVAKFLDIDASHTDRFVSKNSRECDFWCGSGRANVDWDRIIAGPEN